MCYLKDLKVKENLNIDAIDFKDDDSFETVIADSQPQVAQPKKIARNLWKEQGALISKLVDKISKNNFLIKKIDTFISPFSELVENITINRQTKIFCADDQQLTAHRNLNSDPHFFNSQGSMLKRLFGARKYAFGLELFQKFKQTIYKERNFNVSVRLVDAQAKPINNCNAVTLCIRMCTMEGDWISENRIGEPLIKGKTEKELVYGEAQFEKIYSREVSRIYPAGKVAIVIYPKLNNVKCFPSNEEEQYVDSSSIQPLIIENISIRAKKKQCLI